MSGKTFLRNMMSFYKKLDAELDRSDNINENSCPIVIGADAVYSLAKQELGCLYERLIEDCEKRIWGILNKEVCKKLNTRDKRFKSNVPRFDDGDIYIRNPNDAQICTDALEALGYTGNVKDIDKKGYTMFLNNNLRPSKIDLIVNMGDGYLRPRSGTPIETILPYGEGCTNRLDNIKNLLFISPSALCQRMRTDIKSDVKNGKNVRLKMLQDFMFSTRVLTQDVFSVLELFES